MYPSKAFWVFGLLLPMYMIWLRNVGLFTIGRNGRSNKVFNILSAILVVTVFITFLVGYALLFAEQSAPDWVHLITPWAIISIWLPCNAITGKNMVDYENRNNEYLTGMRRKKEYFFRFFHLLYFQFSIYFLQKDVNNYTGIK